MATFIRPNIEAQMEPMVLKKRHRPSSFIKYKYNLYGEFYCVGWRSNHLIILGPYRLLPNVGMDSSWPSPLVSQPIQCHLFKKKKKNFTCSNWKRSSLPRSNFVISVIHPWELEIERFGRTKRQVPIIRKQEPNQKIHTPRSCLATNSSRKQEELENSTFDNCKSSKIWLMEILIFFWTFMAKPLDYIHTCTPT